VALIVVASTPAATGTSTTTTTAGAPTTAARSAGAALGLGAGFVDIQGASAKIFPVQSRDGFFGFRGIGHFYKCKSPGTSSVAVGDQADLIDFAVRFKQRSQFSFRGAVREVANKKLLHGFPFSVSQRNTSDLVGEFG
jgi:hypothetical protein